VGAIIKDEAGRLLLIQRGHEPETGRWSLPGGRVEPGETDEQAVARETREETGLQVTCGALVGSVERPGLRGAVRVDQQVARDPEQPGPDRPVVGAQLGQVTPCPDQDFLDDVICARPVRAEPLDVTMQGLAVLRVQLADRGIGIAG